MASRIGDIVVDCADPLAAAAFWCAALGYRELARDETGIAIAGDPSAPAVLLLASDDPKSVKNRVHLDICPTDREQPAEVERLVSLGATRVDVGQGARSWVVLADPCGNEFCVMARRVRPEPEPFDAR
jgi:Glyoxalase-like domain